MSYAGTVSQPRSTIRPAFQVKKLEGTVVKTLFDFETDKNKRGKETTRMVKRTVEVPAGYMVFFPNRHSIRIETVEELNRLGFNNRAHLINMETGDPVERIDEVDLEVEVKSSSKKAMTQQAEA